MSEEPQFRTVLRGYDPEQVKSVLDELQTSVVTARRLAADRTIELTRMQEHLNHVQRDLDQATARVEELESRPPQAAPSAGDVGARIGSILALANEEAEELRAAGREDARRQLDEADAALAAARAEAQRHADELRSHADDEANRIVVDARHEASEVRAEAARDAEDRRAEAQEIVDRQRAQAAAVAEFGSQIATHTERLRLARERVEQLAAEEAALVERQSQESSDRINRDKQNQLAAVDARRDSITGQLGTLGALLRELGDAVGASPDGERGGATGSSPDDSAAEDSTVETPHGSADGAREGEQSVDRGPENAEWEAQPQHEEAAARP
jgi:chromosome segregation ATPase